MELDVTAVVFLFFFFYYVLHNHNSRTTSNSADDAIVGEWVATRRGNSIDCELDVKEKKKKRRLRAPGRAHSDTCFLYAVN